MKTTDMGGTDGSPATIMVTTIMVTTITAIATAGRALTMR
jgi:hypothetical protein